jgi:hypothetical protein
MARPLRLRSLTPRSSAAQAAKAVGDARAARAATGAKRRGPLRPHACRIWPARRYIGECDCAGNAVSPSPPSSERNSETVRRFALQPLRPTDNADVLDGCTIMKTAPNPFGGLQPRIAHPESTSMLGVPIWPTRGTMVCGGRARRGATRCGPLATHACRRYEIRLDLSLDRAREHGAGRKETNPLRRSTIHAPWAMAHGQIPPGEMTVPGLTAWRRSITPVRERAHGPARMLFPRGLPS